MIPQETQRENVLLRQQLQNIKQAKNHQIIELKHALQRAQIRIKILEDKCSFLQTEARALNQRYRDLQLYSKERSHAITQKNFRISQLQQSISVAVNQKQAQMQNYIDKLLQVIRGQEQELSVYLSDHQKYVSQFEKVAINYRETQAERNLLTDYNAQLEKQIQQVQTNNSSLQSWVSNAYGQLRSQNQQAGDLLSQLQYMMETIAPERA